MKQQRSLPGDKQMVFGETSRNMRLLVVAMFGALLVHSAASQDSSGGAQSVNSLAKKLKTTGLTHTDVQIAPFQSAHLFRSLANSQHALMSVPPPGIVSEMTNADLPSISPKRLSLAGVSGTNFLAPTAVQPAAWKYFNTPSPSASELRTDKHPNLADPQ
jgi:hypothetical protein